MVYPLSERMSRVRVRRDLGERVLISEWTMPTYVKQISGIGLTRISRMKASVKHLTQIRATGLGLGLEKEAQGFRFAFGQLSFFIIQWGIGKASKAMKIFVIAGATEEVAFFSPLLPRRAFFEK